MVSQPLKQDLPPFDPSVELHFEGPTGFSAISMTIVMTLCGMFLSFHMSSTFLTLLNPIWKNSKKRGNNMQVWEILFFSFFWGGG